MKRAFPLLLLILAATCRAEETNLVVRAQLVGECFGKVDTNIVVTAEKQRIFHFHSDFEGGGTWYDAHISLEGRTVTILESDSISAPCKGGRKVETKENIYRLSIDKIADEPIPLKFGNQVTLTVVKKKVETKAQPAEAIDIVRIDADGKVTLNGIAVEITQLSEKLQRPSAIISADKSVLHETIMAVLDEAAKGGISNVSVATAAP